MSSTRNLETALRSFGLQDALFRGTALSANIAHWGLIALLPGFGGKGVLFSICTQLIISGLLEFPTSFVADRFGQARATLIGAMLKIFVTSSLGFACYFAIRNQTEIAFIFLCLESIFDSFANAFLSGSYEASATTWYAKKCGDLNIKEEDRPPLFIASYGYSTPVRIGIPLFIIASTFIFLNVMNRFLTIGQPVILLSAALIFAIIVLRIFVLVGFFNMLTGVDSARSTFKLTPQRYFIDLSSALRGRFHELILNSMASFLMYGVSLFCAGQAFKFISDGNDNKINAWLFGSSSILLMHSISILASKNLFQRITNQTKALAFVKWGSFLFAIIGIGLGIVLFETESKALQGTLLLTFSSATIVLTQLAQRTIFSYTLAKVHDEYRAQWISASETTALLASGAVFSFFYFFDLQNPTSLVIILMSLTALVISVFCATTNASTAPTSLEAYLSRRFFFAVCLAFLVGISTDLFSFSGLYSAREEAVRIRTADLITMTIREPVLQGSFIETRSRIESLLKDDNVICIDVKAFNESIHSCKQERKTAFAKIVSERRNLFYSSESANALGTVEVSFAEPNIFDFLKQRTIQSVASFTVLALLMYLILRRVSAKVLSDTSRLVDSVQREDSTSGEMASTIQLKEFSFLRERFQRIFKSLENSSRDAAIARTTQMLAHDVRKPFTLFRMTLDKVKSTSSPQQMQQVLKEALPEVERSMASVNGLIADVLNVGGEFQLVLKPVRLAPVVEDVSEELRRLHPTRNLRLRIDVASDLWVQADDTRLPRVFLNILSNAIEAVEGPEVQLWVSAQQMNSSDERIEIRVGNRGSYIPSDVREKLFDLFFTSGKKGGTGLGLAIVKKIIDGHGGLVKCHSARTHDEPQGLVEFSWTLKKSIQPKEAVHAVGSSVQAESPTLNDLSEPTQTLIANTGEQPKVVFLDDSPLARWVWEAKLKSTVSLQCFAGPRDFWKAVARNSLALEDLHTIITDHYFAADEKITGLEFASELRARQFKGRILLASNGEFKPEELAGIVDKIVDKQPIEWERL